MTNYIFLIFLSFFISKEEGKLRRETPKKPNIIVILIDDAGYADFGFMGSKDLQTPNIDKLASTSVIFTDAHVSSTVCGPSRAGLITGKYQQRFGYECNEGEGYSGMDESQITLAQTLKSNGYQTAAIGKWHLGYEQRQHPNARGFDYFYGFLSGARSYFYNPNKDDKQSSKSAILENNKQVKFNGYLTDDLGNKAVNYIKKNKNNPFFIYWAPNAVHTPLEATKDDLGRFKGHPRQMLAAMTYGLDRSIGKIMDELKKQGILDNTLVFFLSDNGGAHNNQSINLPLKGFKGNEFEAGHRVPFLMSWQGKLKTGLRFNGLSSSLDIFATCLDAANIKQVPKQTLDGVSLLACLNIKYKGNPHQELFWRKDANAAVRKHNFKLIRVKNVGYRLYDLKNDLGETINLESKDTVMFNTLKNDLIKWELDKIKPLWTEGDTWDTITEMIHRDLMNNNKVKVFSPVDLSKYKLRNE